MKKHILKPGKHQFVPGSAAVHSNDNITDEEATWYLERYPHIARLFIDSLQDKESENTKDAKSAEPKVKRKQIAQPITNSLNQ